MARIRHIALVVKDLEKTATFYEQALGLSRSEMSEGPTARRIYMSDGEVNLALLQYKSEVGSGLTNPNEFVGIHHFGFQCDDLEKQQKQIEKAGGAGTVLDEERLLELLAQRLREPAAHQVGRAAGAQRHDQADWSRGIVLR